VEVEIQHWEEYLPEDIVTRAELEKGISDERLAAILKTGNEDDSRQPETAKILWTGRSQNSFMVWLYQSYLHFMSQHESAYATPASFKTVAKALSPLFYYMDEGETRHKMKVSTIISKASSTKGADEDIKKVGDIISKTQNANQ